MQNITFTPTCYQKVWENIYNGNCFFEMSFCNLWAWRGSLYIMGKYRSNAYIEMTDLVVKGMQIMRVGGVVVTHKRRSASSLPLSVLAGQ